MKVLFTFGGLPHYYNKVLNKLNAQQGIEVVVVAPQQGSQTIGHGVEQQEEGIEFKLIRLPEHKALWGKARFRALRKLLLAEHPDIVVTVWPYVLSYLYEPQLALALKHIRAKLLFKDIPFMLPFYTDAARYYRDPKVLLVNEAMQMPQLSSTYNIRMRMLSLSRKLLYTYLIDAHINYIDGAAPLLASYGAKPETVFVSYNSPDTDLLFESRERIEAKAERILPPNPHRIIHIGRLVKWKRVDLLLDALRLVLPNYPNAELVVVGNGPELNNLKAQAKARQLEAHVNFVGAVYDTDTLGAYTMASAVYVLAGMGGLSLNEAMAYGRPVIASVCDGTEKHLVRNGQNGFSFTEGDAQSLAEAIQSLFSQPQLAEAMGRESTRIIRDEINIQTVINGYLKAFRYLQPYKTPKA